MTRLATALALFLAGCALVLASGRPAHSTPPVVVPYYGATYGGGGITAADGKRIVELLQSIDDRLARAEAAAGGKAASVRIDPFPVAKAKCASCHTPGQAEAKGGGFILFADNTPAALKPLSAREKKNIKDAVLGGTMPPNAKLSAAEKAALEW